jgi:hypothetical protein
VAWRTVVATVAIVQRFGGALNLNVHVHALVLDGVFAKDCAGVVAFIPAAASRTWTWRRCWPPWSPGSRQQHLRSVLVMGMRRVGTPEVCVVTPTFPGTERFRPDHRPHNPH